MSTPYVGEIRMFAGNFAPAGWAFCNGQIMPISENETLFALIGTTYGGDGQETFALPDLRGRIPVHMGNGKILAESYGTEQVSLNTNQLPAHTHAFQATSAPASSQSPNGNGLASPPESPFYGLNSGVPVILDNMGANMVAATGGSQPHNNMMPYTCINFIISLFGIFPSQT